MFEEYVVLENQPIGKGSFGKVYKGYRKTNPKEILAIKRIDVSKFPENQTEFIQKNIESEINSLIDLEHPNIIKLIDFKVDKDKFFYVITEFCNGGDLGNLQGKIPLKDIVKYFKQIVKAMNYANKNLYIHRDLKPQNILLSKGIIKIADFGFARRTIDPKAKMKMTSMIGSYLYMAPEVFFKKNYSSKCDVWSTGCLLYQMIYRVSPWIASHQIDLFLNNIMKIPLEFPKKPKISSDLMDLIKKMLTIDQDKRPDFKEILHHNALKEDFSSSENEEEEEGPPKYIEYLKNMADFFGKLSQDVKNKRFAIGLSRKLCSKLFILLKKIEVILFNKIQKILTGKKLDSIPKKFRGKSTLKKLKPLYIPLFEKSQEVFLEYIEKNQTKNKHFNKFVLNSDWNTTKEFKDEYDEIFKEFIEEFCEMFDRKRNELLGDEDTDDEILRIVLKLIQIRKFQKLKTKFRFDKDEESEDPFIFLEEEINEMKRKNLVKKVLKYQKRFYV